MKIPDGGIKSVAVLGAGTMGHGIAEVCALAGFGVSLYDIEQRFLSSALDKIRWSTLKLAEKGQLSRDAATAAVDRIQPTLDVTELKDADFIIEAVPEDLRTKTEVLWRVSSVNDHALFASNTSAIPISDIAAATAHPADFIGMHFFNPPVLMPLVEVVKGSETSAQSVEVAISFAARIGKRVVVCNKDVPGFIVNRILGPLLNEAAWLLSRGDATVEEIDSAAVYKVGLPMGLFELADLTGIDVIYRAAIAVKSREPTEILGAPPFKEKYEQGLFGRKTGEGFYRYSGLSDRPPIPKQVSDRVDPLSFFSVAINAAAWLLRNRICTREDLDLATKLGLGFPDGILQMADAWGIDKAIETLRAKEAVYGADYSPDPLLLEMSASGKLGIRTNMGFYDHSTLERKLEEVILTKSPPIAWITLNRPHRLNMMTPKMIDELEIVSRDVWLDRSIRVVVVTGEGDKAFSAGADFTAFTPSSSVVATFDAARRMFEVFSLFERMPKPVIAAINGYAYGGGCELALACDFRFLSTSSQIGLTETSLGLMPGAGGTFRLVRLVGVARSREMICLGRRLSAEDALKIGLADKVFSSGEFRKGVEEFAEQLAKRAPLSIKLAKYAINLASQYQADSAQFFEAAGFGMLTSSRDASEGLSAFFSRTEPDFKGE